MTVDGPTGKGTGLEPVPPPVPTPNRAPSRIGRTTKLSLAGLALLALILVAVIAIVWNLGGDDYVGVLPMPPESEQVSCLGENPFCMTDIDSCMCDSLGRIIWEEARLAAGMTRWSFYYDSEGFPAREDMSSHDGTVAIRWDYDYDGHGNRIRMERHLLGAVEADEIHFFTYDDRGRILSEDTDWDADGEFDSYERFDPPCVPRPGPKSNVFYFHCTEAGRAQAERERQQAERERQQAEREAEFITLLEEIDRGGISCNRYRDLYILDRRVCAEFEYAVENGRTRRGEGREIVRSYLRGLGLRRIHAYIVGRIDAGLYECAQRGRDDYFGIAYPTDRHFLLRTLSTDFTTTGRFRMWVRESGTTSVPLRSGFTEEWNIYSESILGELWQEVRDADAGYETSQATLALLRFLVAWNGTERLLGRTVAEEDVFTALSRF